MTTLIKRAMKLTDYSYKYKILGIVFDYLIPLSSYTYYIYQIVRYSNKVLKALADTFWVMNEEIIVAPYRRQVAYFQIMLPQFGHHFPVMQPAQYNALRNSTGRTPIISTKK